MSQTQKVALVTGGGGGIGSAICRKLAEAGYAVIINYRSNLEKAQATLDSLSGDDHMLCQATITEKAELDSMAQAISEKYGKLDLLVNNAGITTPVPHDDLDGLTDEWIDRIMQTNVRGTFACIRAFHSLLKAGESACVINISSIAARTGVGSNVAYCASKAAIDSMTRSLARALAPDVRVMSVAPGWVWGEYASRFPQEYIDEQISKTPLNRIALPEDVADAVLATADNLLFATGSIIEVDGGRPLL